MLVGYMDFDFRVLGEFFCFEVVLGIIVIFFFNWEVLCLWFGFYFVVLNLGYMGGYYFVLYSKYVFRYSNYVFFCGLFC